MRENTFIAGRSMIVSAINAVIVASSLCASAHAAYFGPGQMGLNGAPVGSASDILLDSSSEMFGVGFTALNSGALTTFRFASGNSAGYTNNEANAFTVAIYTAKADGSPDQLVGSSNASFGATGARARSASFSGLNVTAGTNYVAVISSSSASSSKSFQVNEFTLATTATRLNTPDNQVNTGYTYMHSSDGGASWTKTAKSVGVHAVTIGGVAQGFGYTGFVDTTKSFKTTGGQTQYMAQTFTFQTYDAEKPAAQMQNIQIQLRASGALANTNSNVIFRIANASDYSVVSEKTQTVALGAATVFSNVTVDFSGATLLSGNNYILYIGLADTVGTNSATDYIFARCYSWGIGDPSLSDVTFGGASGRAYITSSLNTLDTSANSDRADLPFMIEFTAAPIPEPAAIGLIALPCFAALLRKRK